MNYIYCALIYAIGANIAKVESRGKIYFHYAETKRIYVLQDKYIKYVRIMTDYVVKMIVGRWYLFLSLQRSWEGTFLNTHNSILNFLFA